MTQTVATGGQQADAIRPFHVNVPGAEPLRVWRAGVLLNAQ
jgi:hypothetical protein